MYRNRFELIEKRVVKPTDHPSFILIYIKTYTHIFMLQGRIP